MTVELPTLWVALPAYNEEATLERTVRRTLAALEALPYRSTVVLIDNSSQDRTLEIAYRLSQEEPRLLVLQHPENRLYSGSCQTAMAHCPADYLAIMDSDGQIAPEDLGPMLDAARAGHNLVLGWRRRRHDALGRRLLTLAFNGLGRWLLGFPFHDLNCGLRVLDRRAQQAAQIRHRINMVNPELYVRARVAGLSIAEVEVRHHPRLGGQTSHDFGRLFPLLRGVLHYFLALRRELKADGAQGEARTDSH